ncbi:MAG TPA: GGDEF domain-containing protein [Rhizobacter sp.]|jgi:diguanylate cyclase (GGDEF)-like protein|nr:GGDEF domain-containing protein [Rhizobacter sp.]
MSDKPLRVVWVDLPEASSFQLPGSVAWGPFVAERVAGLDALASANAASRADVVLLCLPGGAHAAPIPWVALSAVCAEAAVLVLTDAMDAATQQRLINTGVQDVVLQADAASLAQRVRLAAQRVLLGAEARKAYATDLGTGLPNRQQMIEHMSQILALREREPKPVSVLVFRMEGLQGVEAAHGHESANVIRRKVAVRLRAGVRASDVVASLGTDVFAVLLPSTEAPTDAQHVVEKLMRSLREPFKIAGGTVPISTHVGLAQFPQDGKQPELLLRHASSSALLGAYGMQDSANE